MNRFHFRLQKYLDLKRQQEMVQRLALVAAQNSYDREVSRQGVISWRIDALLAYGAITRQHRLNIEELLLSESYYLVLVREREEQAQVVEQALEQLSVEQNSYRELQQERKLLERFRDHKWQEYYQEYLSEEQRALDELGTIRYSRPEVDQR